MPFLYSKYHVVIYEFRSRLKFVFVICDLENLLSGLYLTLIAPRFFNCHDAALGFFFHTD